MWGAVTSEEIEVEGRGCARSLLLLAPPVHNVLYHRMIIKAVAIQFGAAR
jgi:hypothetical protein